MNITILARSPPAGFFLCPKSANKQGEELMNDIFANTETMQENEHPRFYTAESVMRGHPDKLCDLIADSVLDACLQHDPASRVACEVMYNKLQANRARIFRPMVDSLLLLKSQQEHQNAARESIYAEIQRLAKQNHNLERIYAQGYIEDAQYIERKTLIEQQLVEKRVQLSRTSISKNVEQTLKSTRQIEKILDSGPPLTYFDEHTFTEMVKKVSVSNTAIEFELINGMKLSEERTEK